MILKEIVNKIKTHDLTTSTGIIINEWVKGTEVTYQKVTVIHPDKEEVVYEAIPTPSRTIS